MFGKQMLAVGVVVALGAAGAAQAQMRVQGNTRIDAVSQNVTTVAAGTNNVAKTTIGGVKGDVKGNTNIAVSAKNVNNVVSGHGRKGCINIGVRGGGNDCQ